MSTNVQIKKVADAQQRVDPVFSAVDRLMNSIRARAYEMFSRRGFNEGDALQDWLSAEREFAWPAAELAEEDRTYLLRMTLPGYSAEQVKVTVTPQEVIVTAAAEKKSGGKSTKSGAVQWSEFTSDEVCRRIELPNAIDTDQVTASLENGMLTVKAVQQARPEKRVVPIGAAA
jgi:HSP20 family protein